MLPVIDTVTAIAVDLKSNWCSSGCCACNHYKIPPLHCMQYTIPPHLIPHNTANRLQTALKLIIDAGMDIKLKGCALLALSAAGSVRCFFGGGSAAVVSVEAGTGAAAVGVASPPADGTAAPVDGTAAPVDGTTAPVDGMAAPFFTDTTPFL